MSIDNVWNCEIRFLVSVVQYVERDGLGSFMPASIIYVPVGSFGPVFYLRRFAGLGNSERSLLMPLAYMSLVPLDDRCVQLKI